MTTQPQPTEALSDAMDALTDALDIAFEDYCDDIEDIARERAIAVDNLLFAYGYRLARAESAPGVTIPFEDVRLCITALNEMPEPEQTTRITIDPYSQAMWRIQRLLDAALADAGTEAE